MDLLKLFIKAAFVENMVFTFFFGMCSYLAVSKTVKTGVGLGAAVIFVLGVTVPVNYLLETYVLKEGALAWLGAEYADMDLSFSELYYVYRSNCFYSPTSRDVG